MRLFVAIPVPKEIKDLAAKRKKNSPRGRRM